MQKKIIKALSSWPSVLTVSLLILVGAMAVKLWPRTVPFSQCSEFYQKYAGSPGIDASFVKNFRINDTLNVDVTVLKATDSVGWATMLYDFDIPTPPPVFMQRISNGEDVVSIKRIFEEDSTPDSSSARKTKAFMAISRLHQSLTIFSIKDNSHVLAIIEYTYPYPNNDQQTDSNPAPINQSNEPPATDHPQGVTSSIHPKEPTALRSRVT